MAEVHGSYQGSDSRNILAALNGIGRLPSPAGVKLSRVVWQYVVNGNCEGEEMPLVSGETGRQINIALYERSSEQAHSGEHSWKIRVNPGSFGSPTARVFVGYNVPYARLLPMGRVTFSAWVYVSMSGFLALSEVYLETICREVDAEGRATFESTQSEVPAAYDKWERLEVSTMVASGCRTVRLALRIADRTASHIIYWDDISVRSEL